MKNIIFLLIILQFVSCVSTKNVAERRNSDFSAHNDFEFFKIWREIDIKRFNSDILNVNIALVPAEKTINEFKSDSQSVQIYDSLHVIIEEKMQGFRDLEKSYVDTTEQGKQKIYQDLKSDSSDTEFLENMANNPYIDLYEEIINRLRTSIQQSVFYSSQTNFESYIRNRSFEVVDLNNLEEIFRADKIKVESLSDNIVNALKKHQINFIIAFSGSYNVDYSDRARGRIGSEKINLFLFDVQSMNHISSATLTHFWGSE